jgi:hypothetical protein
MLSRKPLSVLNSNKKIPAVPSFQHKHKLIKTTLTTSIETYKTIAIEDMKFLYDFFEFFTTKMYNKDCSHETDNHQQS